MWPGKAHQDSAVLDPLAEPVERFIHVADISKDQHRQLTLEEPVDRFRRRDAFRQPHISKWIECAREVVGRPDQRLRAVGGRARDDADCAPAPALVQKLDGAGRAFANDLEPRNIIADLNRQVDNRVGFQVAGLEAERRFTERQTLEVDGIHHAAVVRAGLCAKYLHGQRTGRVIGGGEGVRNRQTSLDDGERMIADGPLQAFDERRAVAEIDAIREPYDFDVRCGREKAFDERQCLASVNTEGLRLDLPDLDTRGAGKAQGNIAVGFRERQERYTAIVGFRARDEFVRSAQPRIPGRRGRPAVVEYDQQRRGTVRRRERRVPQRAGGGDDDERSEGQPQQSEPPGRACRRFLLGGNFKQQSRRRKVNAAGPRRDETKQPPQDRQAEQPEQNQWLGKA